MKFIKLNHKAFSPFIILAINHSIAGDIFLDNMKVAKILPILKLVKYRFKKEFFESISNLCCLEKIIEEHIKIHMIMYFEENYLILKNHLGGLKGKTRMTARAIIQHKI